MTEDEEINQKPISTCSPYRLAWRRLTQDFRPVPQHRALMAFCINVGSGSLAPCRPDICCVLAAACGLARRLGRLAFEFWNWACVDAVGVEVSCPPAGPLWRFAWGTPEPLGRSRVLPAPGLPGDGGGGCAAFKRSAVIPGLELWRAWVPCRLWDDVFGTWLLACPWCCDEYDLYSQPLPLFNFIQSYSPSSTSPVFFKACVKRSRR